jgi:hypothetical protein
MDTTTLFEFVGEGKMQESNCIAIAFRRPTTGGNPVFINGYPLEAGQTFRVAQNVGDIDRTQYQITFGAGSDDDICYVFRTLNEFCYATG